MRRSIVVSFLLVIFSVAIAGNLTLTIESNEYEIEALKEGQEIRMEGFGNLLVAGKPMLPAKTFLIALPPGAKVSSVTVTELEPTILPETYKIRPAPPMLPSIYPADKKIIEKIHKDWKENYEQTYSSDKVYPAGVGKYEGSGGLRKYTFARVSFFPFAYRPKSGRLILYRSARVSIDYTLPSPGSPEARRVESLLSDTLADSRARKLFVNWSQAKWWYLPKNPLKESRSSLQPYSYVIITTTALQSAVSSLVSWKQATPHPGHTVSVVTTSWIQANYSGVDLQEQIRNFLIANYVSWGIQYVLLVGDTSDVPMRVCSPNPNTHSDDTPTDYYYADLTGNWNSDGDSYWGEYGEDSVDWVPEVYVGRIPTSDSTMVSNICQKLVDFEQDTGGWKNNALLLGAISNFDNEDGTGMARTCGHYLMERMVTTMLSGWTYHRMYEKAGLSPCTQPCDAPLANANVITYWGGNDYGVVNWWAHGGQTGAHRKIWSWDDGDHIPEWFEMSSPTFFQSSDCFPLDDDHPSIVFANSCLNGYPENSNNLGKRLLEHGSSGIVAASRVSWYSVGWQHESHGGNASIDYYFFDYLINSDERVGEALFDSKVYYSNHFMFPSWGYVTWQNMFTFNLYGDPDLYRPGHPTTGADITVVSIDEPGSWGVLPDTVWAGATYRPKATIRNNGPADAVNIEVSCIVVSEGVDYISSMIIDSLGVGDTIQVTFNDDWTISETYSSYPYIMMVEATYLDDPDSTNNSKYKQYINLADIQISSIDEPEELWTGTPYTPKATVKNNSPEGYVTLYATCTIDGYSSAKSVNHLAAGKDTQMIFDEWTSPEIPCDTFIIEISTSRPYDPNPDNNVNSDTLINKADVTVISIDEPSDVVLTGTDYTPKITVKNSSPQGKVTFGLNCAIDLTASLATAEPNSQIIPSQTASLHNQGIRKFSIGRNLSKTAPSANIHRIQRLKKASIEGANQFTKPKGSFSKGNPSRYSLTYPEKYQPGELSYRISSFEQMNGYSKTEFVPSLPAGQQVQISFPDWTTSLSACAQYDVIATADISCDPNPDDNTRSKITNATGDVGISDAIEPLNSVYVDSSYNPTVTLKNFTSGSTEAFPCSLYIEDGEGSVVYQSAVSINGLTGDEEREITFDEWVVEDTGTYSLYATSYLPCDDNPNNDTHSWTVKTILSGILDVGVEEITMPEYSHPGDTVYPNATVKNYGTINPPSFDVECKIEPGDYIDTKTVIGLEPDSTYEIEFMVWIPEDTGSYKVTVTTLLEDDNPANDSKVSEIIPVVPGITEKPVPKKFALSLIKPNPMNSRTVISYQLPVTSKVSLTIYDISGKLVKTLATGTKDVGFYTAIWDGRNDMNKAVPAGIYFIRFETSEYKITRKLVLLTK